MEPDWDGPIDFEDTPVNPGMSPSRSDWYYMIGLVIAVGIGTIGVPLWLYLR